MKPGKTEENFNKCITQESFRIFFFVNGSSGLSFYRKKDLLFCSFFTLLPKITEYTRIDFPWLYVPKTYKEFKVFAENALKYTADVTKTGKKIIDIYQED